MPPKTFPNSPAKPHLQSTEFIVWQAQPVALILPNRHDLIFIPLSIIWLFVVVVLQGAHLLAGGDAAWKHLASVVALFIGFHGLCGRWLVRYWALRDTTYVLTNRRVLVIGGTLRAQPVALSLSEIAEMIEHKRGSKLKTVVLTTAHGRRVTLHNLTETAELLDIARRMRATQTPYATDRAGSQTEREQARGFLRKHYTTQ